MTVAEKVLVVGPSWVGDMVMAQALYRLLVRRAPDTEIHVLAPPWSAPVLARMPEVARSIELAVGHGELKLGLRRAVAKRLRAAGYSRAIVLPRSAKAALVPWLAAVPRRIGFRGEWRYGLINDVRPLLAELDQTVKRFVALGLDVGEPVPAALPDELFPRLRVDEGNLERLRREHGLGGGSLVALLPGAEYGAAKRWPADRYAELAARLVADGHAVIVLGSAKERVLGDEVARGRSGVMNLCGSTSLADVVDLLSAVAVAVSNDSGLMHVAAAAGAPVVALYGSSTPAFTPPLSTVAVPIYLALSCSPCFARECPLGHLRCLREIAVPRVLAQVEECLVRRESSAHG